MSSGMEQAILDFPTQFGYEPELVNAEKLGGHTKFVLLGMGGSHLQADVVRRAHPEIDLVEWNDYGLPPLSDIKERLIIASSYSGNTEEVVSGLMEALERQLSVAILTTGGTLIQVAKEHDLPHVLLPATGIQPRSALGFAVRGLLELLGLHDDLESTKALQERLDSESLRGVGESLAGTYKDMVPVIYTSRRNRVIAYNWKIKCNETGKIPAFYNVLPELNHNELAGMDVIENTKHLSDRLVFFFISDSEDHERVQLRMRVTMQLYKDRGLAVEELSLSGEGVYERMFNSLLVADWFAYTTAVQYGAEPEQVPIIEEFKKTIS